MAGKAQLVKGTRDFSPEDMLQRNHVTDTIRSVFSSYNFSQIETPAMETLSTLMGKYGDEGDKLIFKILNSGDYLKDACEELLTDKNSQALAKEISEKALRYDLTVPFARYVSMNQSDISFPFRRYQIQPVWRADRPQRGRYREFYQCDADIVGSASLWQEVELIKLYDEVFTRLGLCVTVHINNRKILQAVAARVGGCEADFNEIVAATDLLDKGTEEAKNYLASRRIKGDIIEKLLDIKAKAGSLELISKELGKDNDGVGELEFIFDKIGKSPLKSAKLKFDITLARGLNYYTGTIFEVKAGGVQLGSIGGGGRYDELTSIFGLKGVSGVGISFGLDRIILCMQELGLFEKLEKRPKVLLLNFGEKEAEYAFAALDVLRKSCSAMLYPDAAKISKQLDYANKNGFRFALLAGESEMQKSVFTCKDLESGWQKELTLNELGSL